ncbi:ImmA/IrrE family metallo-endopeptidase [Candidatus Parcubacteria bacterium]|nr:ImmA/IrrE family metallo-endopeptidase [Candidatus Parcubacteria bacterium]
MTNEYKSVADDMLKPKIKNAQLKATEIWNDFCDKKIPIQLNDIIQKLGIKIKSENLTIDGITRTSNNGICFILYSKNISVVRQRFTVAHEIGHIVLEHTSIFDDCDQFSEKSQNKEADSFAGELLVPSSDIKKFVKEKSPTIQNILDRYWISQGVAFIAIENNRLLNKIKT